MWEQYLTWPLPFLIALALLRRDLRAGLLAAGLSLATLFTNYRGQGAGPVTDRFYMHLLPHPTITVNVLLALGIVLYIVFARRLSQPLGDRAELRALRWTPPRRHSGWSAPVVG